MSELPATGGLLARLDAEYARVSRDGTHAYYGNITRAYPELRELLTEAADALAAHQQIDTPGWDTKIKCRCGERFASRAEHAFHRGRELDPVLARLREVGA